MGKRAWQGGIPREKPQEVRVRTCAGGAGRLGEVAEKPSLQGQGDVQTEGNQAAQPCCKGAERSIGQRREVASVHLKIFLFEPSAEFLLRKRFKMAESQVGHGQPPVTHRSNNAKYLPGSPTRPQSQYFYIVKIPRSGGHEKGMGKNHPKVGILLLSMGKKVHTVRDDGTVWRPDRFGA